MKKNNAHVGTAHEHQQSCFSVVKMVREMNAKHSHVCNTFSCEDKRKTPLGVPAVHRLVSLNKFFTEGEVPILPDHDLRSGLLVCPNG